MANQRDHSSLLIIYYLIFSALVTVKPRAVAYLLIKNTVSFKWQEVD
jgi:hypothetical protein